MKLYLIVAIILAVPVISLGQHNTEYTKADTLRGSLNPNRDWWDVLRYDIEVQPDFETKTITGKTEITFKRIRRDRNTIQIDLRAPLIIDSVHFLSGFTDEHNKAVDGLYPDYRKLPFQQDSKNNVAYVDVNQYVLSMNGGKGRLMVYYHGTPCEAKNAPWDGGWIWKKDSLGRPWMSVAVQGLGASAWYPCKDYQGDEPDSGASLTVIVPDTLVAVGNGRLTRKFQYQHSKFQGQPARLMAYQWEVKNPINNYNIVPYIGKYVNFTDTLMGENGKLDMSFWVLDYNKSKALQQFTQAKTMLRCFEHWFGPYPFYEDSYKLVDAPHLGMEHQSAVAYGNGYKNGYRGRDLSGTGWGLKWDFIIVHESGHEWFANNITTKDIADMWVHEGFTNYSETLYTEWLFGKQAGDAYNVGIRRNIRNDIPIIGPYGVNKEGSGDMYYKSGNMIHAIRKVINDDEKFREILRGLNQTFWHQTVTTQQIEQYIIEKSGIDFQTIFDQYLRTTQIPQLEFYSRKGTVYFRWTNCVDGFNLPLVINGHRYAITTKWKSSKVRKSDLSAWNAEAIIKQYYIAAKQVSTR